MQKSRYFVMAVLWLSALSLGAQGLINNGARIVLTNGSAVVVDGATGNYTSQAGGLITNSTTGGSMYVAGNWVNNAGNAGFSNDGATVLLNGAAQNIGGSASTTFFNLSLLGTGSKTLGINTTVGGISTLTGVLSLGTRPLVLNSFTLNVSNPNGAAITNTTGYIQSETNLATNPSIVSWQMGTTTGAHVYPFGTAAAVLIPFTFNKVPATSATVSVATRSTAASNNNPWATGVTHMYDPTLAQDGSDEAVIDRWWEINSTAAITANLTFSYRGNTENTLVPAFNTGTLGAQYWATGAWLPDNAVLGSGTGVTAGVGSVTANGVSIAAAYTPWVLSSQLAPLPVEWLTVTGNCANNHALLRWSTATEQNNDYFTIERSTNGTSWTAIGNVQGAGNSSMINNYQFIDPLPLPTINYYRIRQTDFNGSSSASSILMVSPCVASGDVVDAFAGNGNIFVNISAAFAQDYRITLYDSRGRLVSEQQFAVQPGANRFELEGNVPATGVYMVSVVSTAGERISKKLFVSKE
ncbi:MAG: T9SS type A sorting domain-containing protein [Bacteroidia bacterium]|nr:T9SS type A sorting domain-containing protein [Bacteroidia bacterium]